ncbi:MAG: ChbG/HpnK family deacetylase [Nitrospiraceae bacterium]|nr:ChbG/HpnK family deacetylase [Nitrospiraceae bacterium]
MKKAAIGVVLVALLWAAPALSEPTYGERLGWGPSDRILIIHCDDVGMSYASNRGATEALDYGLVTSVSVMMPCPWVGGFAEYVKANPNVDVGLHLTLTSEYDYYRWMPVAGKTAVPGLADKQGCLPDGVSDVVQNATPDEVETEIRAQVDRAETMGLPITHLDSHMGTLFATPEFFERYAKVGIEKGIPILIPANTAGTGADPEFVKAAAAMVWAGGLPVIDYVHASSYDWKTTDKREHYSKAIRELKPGITEMIVHCTKPDDVIGQINGNRDHLYGDYTAMISPEVKKVIEEEGIILTTWRELKKRRQAAKD